MGDEAWLKDSKAFWFHFTRYVKQHPGQAIPVHYEEAAYLYSVQEELPNIDNMPFSQSVKEKYAQFDQMAAQCDGLSLEEAREALRPMFGNTYFYDHFLMSNLPEY